MDDGISPDSAQEIDKLHAALANDAAASTAENSDLATQPDSQPDSASIDSPNKDFCQEMLASACRWHAETTRKEFIASLAPVERKAPDQCARIAERAAMSPALQAAIASNGARVLCKYGLGKFLNDEAVLVSALCAYFYELSGAKKDRDALLQKYAPTQTQNAEQ